MNRGCSSFLLAIENNSGSCWTEGLLATLYASYELDVTYMNAWVRELL